MVLPRDEHGNIKLLPENEQDKDGLDEFPSEQRAVLVEMNRRNRSLVPEPESLRGYEAACSFQSWFISAAFEELDQDFAIQDAHLRFRRREAERNAVPTGEATAIELDAILRRLDEVHEDLGQRLDDLKQSQAIIFERIDAEAQEIVKTILSGVRAQSFSQSEMQNTLDAIRRVLKHIQKTGLPVEDLAIEKSLDEIYKAVNSNMDFGQQLELSLPIIPFLLDYKVDLSAGVDLGAVWKELIERIRKKQERPSNDSSLSGG